MIKRGLNHERLVINIETIWNKEVRCSEYTMFFQVWIEFALNTLPKLTKELRYRNNLSLE